MRKIKLYGPFLLGLVILLVIAFLLPQMIFQVQDGYRFAGKSVETWNYSENAAASGGYEEEMYRRMVTLLAKDVNELTISTISYGGKNVDEVVELLERIFASEWMGYINEMTDGMYYEFLQKTSTISIQECKKYVVYENSALENILLMMWYVDIYMVDYNTSVRLLVDVETESVYFIKIAGMRGEEKLSKNNDKWVKAETDGGYVHSPQEICNMAPYYMTYFNEYYEAGMEDLEGFMEDGWENDDVWYVTRKKYEERKSYLISFVIPYGNVGVEFEVCASEGNGSLPDFSAGINLIRDFVPEMIQN